MMTNYFVNYTSVFHKTKIHPAGVSVGSLAVLHRFLF
jgi:hypothetical protein